MGSCPSWPHWGSCGDIADLNCWGTLLAADHLAANLTFGMTARVDGDVPIAAEEIGGLVFESVVDLLYRLLIGCTTPAALAGLAGPWKSMCVILLDSPDCVPLQESFRLTVS